MRKYIFSVLICMICMVKPIFAAEESFEYLNWTYIRSDVAVKVIDGRSYVPVRELSNVIDGMSVSYNSEQKLVIVSFREDTLEIPLDSSIMVHHKGMIKQLVLDPIAEVKVIGGNTYVPIRLVSDYTAIAAIYQDGYLYITDTTKRANVEPTKQSIYEYVKGNYSVCSTAIGDIELNFKVEEKYFFEHCYDFQIKAERNLSWFTCSKNAKSKEDIKKAQQQLKDHMKLLAEDLISKLPNTRLIGGYDESYYTYPHIRVDLNIQVYCTWKNFDCGSKCGKKDKPSGFRWEEYSKDFEY